MDKLDSKVIVMLSKQGRMSWADLAQHLGLSAPAAADRVRKLEESGLITGYSAITNPSALGLSLAAFISVTFGKSKHRKQFLKAVQKIPEIVECHQVTGEEDFLLKVLTRDTVHLEQLIHEQVRTLPGVLRTKTKVVLSTQKDGPFQPGTEADLE